MERQASFCTIYFIIFASLLCICCPLLCESITYSTFSMDGGPGRVFPKILPDAVTILLLTLKRPLAFREFAEFTRDQRTVRGVCDAVCTCVSGLCYDRGRKEKKDGGDNPPPSSPLRLSDI